MNSVEGDPKARPPSADEPFVTPQTRQDEPHAFDGVIAPPEDAAANAEDAFARAQAAADRITQLVNDDRTVGGASKRPSLDDMDAAIAKDADGVIESVFSSVEDLLGEDLTDGDLAQHDEPIGTTAAPDEGAAPNSDSPAVDKSIRGAPDIVGDPSPVDHPEASVEAPSVSSDDNLPFGAGVRSPDTKREHDATQPAAPALKKPRFVILRRILSGLRAALQPARLRAIVIMVLSVVSWPLRLAPEWARPYVDWLALSLVFWIPVIWVVALVVVGR